MPTLKQQVADKKAQESALKRTPEIDAKLDAFIAANPVLAGYYNGFTKEELIRKLMLSKMNRAEYREGRNVEVRTWVAENPEAKARIEERIRHVPPANREKAFLRVAQAELQNAGLRQRAGG